LVATDFVVSSYVCFICLLHLALISSVCWRSSPSQEIWLVVNCDNGVFIAMVIITWIVGQWIDVNEQSETFQLTTKGSWRLPALPSASILIIVRGEATLQPMGGDEAVVPVKRGDIFFIAARAETAISGATDLDAYRAFTPLV
jgi:hypothetical protein